MQIRHKITKQIVTEILNPITNKKVKISDSLARNLCNAGNYEPVDENDMVDKDKLTLKPKKKRGPKKKENKEAENRLTK